MDDFGRKKDHDWSELDDKGKIERLSHVIQDQTLLLEKMANYLNLLVDHDHLGGKIVQPIGKPETTYTINDSFHHPNLPVRWLY